MKRGFSTTEHSQLAVSLTILTAQMAFPHGYEHAIPTRGVEGLQLLVTEDAVAAEAKRKRNRLAQRKHRHRMYE